MTVVLEMDFTLRDGTPVWFRPISPADAPHLIDIYDHLSPESRYLRFHQSLEGISQEQVEQRAAQTAYDSVAHGFGLLAFGATQQLAHNPLGGARYYLDNQTADAGELAITIRDDAQRQGLGQMLLNQLIDEARSRGIRYLKGTALHSNTGIWRLLRSTMLPLESWHDGPDSFFKLAL